MVQPGSDKRLYVNEGAEGRVQRGAPHAWTPWAVASPSANVHKGQVLSQSQSLARDVATYVVSPPMAVRRIARYDGERVTYPYRSHSTERVEQETVEVQR